jgi:hypothetical protein
MQDSLEIDIRLSHPQDAPAIAKVLYESFVEYEALYRLRRFFLNKKLAGCVSSIKPAGDDFLVRVASNQVE